MLISFAFIFLLSMSIVSAGWFSELFSKKSTGEITITGNVAGCTKAGKTNCENCAKPSSCQLRGCTWYDVLPSGQSGCSSGAPIDITESIIKEKPNSPGVSIRDGVSKKDEIRNIREKPNPLGKDWTATTDIDGNICWQKKAGTQSRGVRSLFGKSRSS